MRLGRLADGLLRRFRHVSFSNRLLDAGRCPGRLAGPRVILTRDSFLLNNWTAKSRNPIHASSAFSSSRNPLCRLRG
ncbi:hypothetical protein D3C83_175190 [compost metagenome]